MSSSPSHKTRRRTILAALAAIGLVAQPAFVDRQPDRQAEFAFELFAKGAPPEEYVIEFPDERLTVTVPQLQRTAPANLDYTEVYPGYLCERYPAAVEVEVYRSGGPLSVTDCGTGA
ncbi:MAG: hypothetical protein WEA76_11665 [Acidimicrobiia bacterium]